MDPGPLPGGVPKPLSPSAGTELPGGETVPVGFTWRGVKGAQAYVVEVSNYVAALEHGLARLRGGLPLCNRLIREIHAKLLARGRGSGMGAHTAPALPR